MQLKRRFFSFLIIFCMLFGLTSSVYADGDDTIMVSVAVPAVSAKALIMIDANSGQVIFESSADEQLPVTYLAKLMTLLLTVEAIEKGKLNFDTKVTTSSHANSMGDPQIWLNVGEQITVEELIKSITIGNANDACVALAEAVGGTESDFVNLMNNRATELGMNNTVFLNCTGIETNGQFSTARDLAILSKEILKHQQLIPYMTTWMVDVRDEQTNLVNTNTMVRTYKGITGIKAATSKEAGNCLIVSAQRNNLHLICVMLGCPDAKQRFVDMKTLLDFAFATNEYLSPNISKEDLKDIKVKGGEEKKVSIKCRENTGIIIEKGKSKNIKTNIIVNESVDAPVEKGQVVGEVQFYDDDKLIYSCDIITEEKVNKITFKFCFKKLVEHLLKI